MLLFHCATSMKDSYLRCSRLNPNSWMSWAALLLGITADDRVVLYHYFTALYCALGTFGFNLVIKYSWNILICIIAGLFNSIWRYKFFINILTTGVNFTCEICNASFHLSWTTSTSSVCILKIIQLDWNMRHAFVVSIFLLQAGSFCKLKEIQ